MRLLPVGIRLPRARLLAALLAVLACCVLLTPSSALGTQSDTAGRDDTQAPLDIFHMPSDCFGPGQGIPPPGACYLRPFKKYRPTILLWGDSHAWMYLPALTQAVKHEKVNLVSFVAGSCPPTLIPQNPQDHYGSKCELNNVLAIRWVTQHQRAGEHVKVILSSNWVGFRRAYRQLAAGDLPPASGYNAFTQRMIYLSHMYTEPLFARLAKLRVPTDVMRQAATVPALEESETGCTVGAPPYNAYVCDLLRSRAIPEEHHTDRWLRGLMKPLAEPHRYIDTTGVYCDALVCHGRIAGINTFYDHLHLSATRSATMARFFKPSIDDELKLAKGAKRAR